MTAGQSSRWRDTTNPSKPIAFADRNPKASLVATASYFVTLVAVRILTTLSHSGPGPDISIAGTHIHHFVFGILAILVVGVLALDDLWPTGRAVLFGIGAALVLDEFALAVFLKDVYWLPQGSLSLIALAVGFVALVINAWRARRVMWPGTRGTGTDRS